nr:MAG TPA: hypothetical protein [Caudoviricetes sp.]
MPFFGLFLAKMSCNPSFGLEGPYIAFSELSGHVLNGYLP